MKGFIVPRELDVILTNFALFIQTCFFDNRLVMVSSCGEVRRM